MHKLTFKIKTDRSTEELVEHLKQVEGVLLVNIDLGSNFGSITYSGEKMKARNILDTLLKMGCEIEPVTSRRGVASPYFVALAIIVALVCAWFVLF